MGRGEVIGYVEFTGLATELYVCFRMKKDGKPINHLKKSSLYTDPLPFELRNEYFKHRDSILVMMHRYETINNSDNELVKSIGENSNIQKN
ncbi:MAG: hypothetical protein R2771_05965 [Saprospiraceae bacterium]